MRYIFSFISFIFFSTLYGQNANLAWAKNIGSASGEIAGSIAVDGSGNVYTTGIFQGTVDFDPGAGVFNLISAGGADIFIIKSDASGNFVWAKNMGGTSDENSNSIAVDALGNVYTTGVFRGTADFDPGAGTHNLSSAGDLDIFISKLDSSGNFVWAKNVGSALFDYSISIAVDALGNVYTTGEFQGTVDFDPGIGTHLIESAGELDIFISKLDASGNFVWAGKIGGELNDFASSIAVDASGNVFTTGNFSGGADFDPGPGTYNLLTFGGGSHIFVSKLDASGNFVWAKNMGGPDGATGYSIAVTDSGNVYTTGRFSGTADFDPDAGDYSLTSDGIADIFVSKLDASGNFVWAKNMGGASEDFGNSTAVDASGNVYTTGSFQGTSDFDPGTATHSLTSAGGSDIFISKLDASGNFVWAQNIGGASNDVGNSVAADAYGNVYATGYFQGTADFDPGAAAFNLVSAGGIDVFIVKLSQPVADLELTKTADKTSLIVGNSLNYTLTLVNKGPAPAINILVTDIAPAGISFGQVTASAGEYDKNTGTWSIGVLSNGGEATLTIVATATEAGTLTNTAEVTASDLPDPDSSPDNGVGAEDDQSSVSVQVSNGVSVEALIKLLDNKVDNLVQQGELSIRHGRFLAELLHGSLDFYKKGFAGASIFTLRAFIVSVKTLVWSHQLSKKEGQKLIWAAQNIIQLIESEKRHKQNQDSNPITLKDSQEDKPAKFRLYQNYPNPFYASTVIPFELAKKSKTQLAIYNADGGMIEQLLDKVVPAGKHSISWQPKHLSSGIYLLRFQAGSFCQTQRMVLVK